MQNTSKTYIRSDGREKPATEWSLHSVAQRHSHTVSQISFLSKQIPTRAISIIISIIRLRSQKRPTERHFSRWTRVKGRCEHEHGFGCLHGETGEMSWISQTPFNQQQCHRIARSTGSNNTFRLMIMLGQTPTLFKSWSTVGEWKNRLVLLSTYEFPKGDYELRSYWMASHFGHVNNWLLPCLTGPCGVLGHSEF